MSHGQTIISFKGVDKAFGDNVVYEGMDLEICEGETLTVIGGSGLGKSVCLKLMIGLLRADDGSITYRGKEVGEMGALELRDLRRKVSYVFQGGALFDSMTVAENVSYALVEHTEMGDDEIRERVVRCLAMVGLGLDLHPDIMDLMPAGLSGGMRKRVALARSIALEPEVILYDEPTTGLDPANCKRVAYMIRKLQKELGVTSVVVTHDMPTAWFVADRVALLWDRSFPFVDKPADFQRLSAQPVQDFITGAY
jgi:phospholipid/cholesterol/gamma-HCH transport system ATP-binding protein